jgi:hypothetical protein
MKNKVKIMMLIVTCMSMLSMYSNPLRRVINVEGKFLHQKNITYTLYELQSNGTYKRLETNKGRKSYALRLHTNTTYVIKFVDKSLTVKFLELRIEKPTDMLIDVDFNTNKSIRVIYNRQGLKVIDMQFDEIGIT